MSEIKNICIDVLIIGGGIAGLFTFRRLKNLGYSVVLLEKNALGAGQTLASQGIIHGGSKYALQGAISGAAKSVSHMTSVWASYLKPGASEIDLQKRQNTQNPRDFMDLSGVKILSQHHYLWASGFGAGLKTLMSSKILSSENRVLKPVEYPEIFQHPSFSGSLCELDEVVVDSQSLLENLVGADQKLILKMDDQWRISWGKGQNSPEIFYENSNNSNNSNLKLSLTAENYIFAAGEGNGDFLERIPELQNQRNSRNSKNQKMQTRPLKMVMVKHPDLKPIYAHYVGSGTLPELTITSHKLRDKQGEAWVWYLGGVIAEEGVKRSDLEQYQEAAKLLRQRFSWLDLSGAEYAVLDISRAEIFNQGKRPDNYGIFQHGKSFFVWPTKLTLAPALAEDIVGLVIAKQKQQKQHENLEEILKNFPKAQVGKAPWEDAKWERL